MKRCAVVCIMLVFACSLGAAQTEKPKVRGIASYTIGESRLDLFLHRLDSIGVKPMVESDFVNVLLAEEKNGFVIAEIVRNAANPATNAPISPHVRVFYVTKITVASLEIPALYLFFYDGILFRTSFEMPTATREAFRLKYGDGEISSRTVQVECTRRGGFYKGAYDEWRYEESWVNGSIKGRLNMGLYYDSDCQKQGYSIMTIEDINVAARVEAEEKSAQDSEKKAKDASLREATKGL